MPPQQPGFLPRQPRRLDPTRHLKSRELWNQVRFHASSHDNEKSLSWEYYRALLFAILYEIQPFRINPSIQRLKFFILEEDGPKKILVAFMKHAGSIISVVQQVSILIYHQIKNVDVKSTQTFLYTNKALLTRSTLAIIAIYLYYHLLVYLHNLLHAGPILFIMTCFILLYTVGLGDNTGANSGVPSAYSVFNRGMQRILGTVDGEELARQYAGGAMMARLGMNGNNNGGGNGWDNGHDGNGDGGGWVRDEGESDEEEEEEQNIIHERRRRRRLERLERRNNNDGEDLQDRVDAINDAGTRQNGGNQSDDDDFDDDEADSDDVANVNNHRQVATAGAKKSGKKARRRNLELRREMQRQRQAAHALGFGAGDANDEDFGGRDFGAMDPLVEE